MKKRLLAVTLLSALIFGSISVQAAPKTMPDGGTFDPQYYAATYPDVAAAFGNNEALLYQHYLTNGKAEGRLPYAAGSEAVSAAAPSSVKTMPDGGLFDAAFYAATYPDVAAVFGNNEALLYQHYLTSGKAEGRLPYAAGSAAAAAVPLTAEAPTPVQTTPTLWTIDSARSAAEVYRQQIMEMVLASAPLSTDERMVVDAQVGLLAQNIVDISQQFNSQSHGTVYWDPVKYNASLRPIIPVTCNTSNGPVIVLGAFYQGYGAYYLMLATPTPPVQARRLHVIAWTTTGRKLEKYLNLQSADGHFFTYQFYLGTGTIASFSIFGS